MKKWTALLLMLLMLLGAVACGGEAEPEPEPDSVTPAAQPGSEPEPEEAEDEVLSLNQAFLTGEAKDADYPEGKRITAVMVNNIASARPSYGLSEAKVLVEIKVEMPITRFMAIFEDYEAMPRVGSLRSARDQFLQLLIPFWGFYVHEGPDQNQPTNWMLSDYEYAEYDFQPRDYGSLIWTEAARNGSTYSWHNISGETLTAAVGYKGSDDYRTYIDPIFQFVPYNQPVRVPVEGTAGKIAIPHTTSYLTYFDYNAEIAKYEMSMFNSYNGQIEATVDGNNNQRLAFDNVLVLFAPMTFYDASPLIKADYSQGGGGYLFTQGAWEPVIWRKGAPTERLWLEYASHTDESDRYVKLNVGTTYLAMVDDDEGPTFDNALRTGSMEGISGEMNTTHQDTED